ncbi:translocation protein SEC62 [Nematocida sp. AWRm78]|nr:translocation protein SEC62 [Nematocida sp. AWRm79]KAI5183328.1 translocation protein SEC62 [Nematocida sp. AWRm78]
MAEVATPRHFTVSYAEKSLRDIETTESILNKMKRISIFKGSHAVNHLMSKKGLLASEAKEVMSILLDNHYIVRVRPVDDQHILDISYEFNINHEYIWIKEGSKTAMYLLSMMVFLAALILAMFPIWPRSVKMATGYLFYAMIGIVVFLISITIIRAVIYLAVLLVCRRSFWLFPNLYAECGILESFVPLYGWDEEIDQEPELQEKKNK